MVLNRNLNLGLAFRQVRIGDGHVDRPINLLTRGDDDIAVLVDLDRDVIAVLILGRDLGVIVRVGDLDTGVLLLIGRINRGHIRIINRGLNTRLCLGTVVVLALLVAVDRNLNLDLALRQIRILNGHRDRAVNPLARSDNNVAVLVDLNRDVIAVLILGRDLGVIVRIGDLDTGVLLLIGRINRLHTRGINRGLNSNRQRDHVGVFGLVAVLINQGVSHGHIRLLFRSLNLLGRRTSDLAVLVLQTGRKTLNLDGVLLQLEALRQLVKTFRLDFLLVRLTDETVGQLGVRHRDLGDYALVLLLSNLLRFGLFDTLFRIFLVRVLVDRITLLIKHRNILFNLDLNLTGYGHFGGTRLGWGAGDLAGLGVNFETIRQIIGRVGRLSPLIQLLLEQRRYVVVWVLFTRGAQRQLLRHNRSKGVCNLPPVRRLLRHRINADYSSGVNRGLLQIFRSLEITRRQRTLVVTLDDAHRILKLFLSAILSRGVPADCIISIRHQTSSLGGHLRARTTLIVVRVVLRNIKDGLRRHQREANTAHVVTRA